MLGESKLHKGHFLEGKPQSKRKEQLWQLKLLLLYTWVKGQNRITVHVQIFSLKKQLPWSSASSIFLAMNSDMDESFELESMEPTPN